MKAQRQMEREHNCIAKARESMLRQRLPFNADQSHQFAQLTAAHQALGWVLEEWPMAASKAYIPKKLRERLRQ